MTTSSNKHDGICWKCPLLAVCLFFLSWALSSRSPGIEEAGSTEDGDKEHPVAPSRHSRVVTLAMIADATTQERPALLVSFLDQANEPHIRDVLHLLTHERTGTLDDSHSAIIVSKWLELHPQNAIDWMHEFGSSENLTVAYEVWATLQEQQAWAEATQRNDPALMRAVLGTLASRDASKALDLARSSLPTHSWHRIHKLFYQLGRTVPYAGIAAAMELPGASRQQWMLRECVSGWTEVDPKAAWQWVAEQDAGIRSKLLTNNFIFGLDASATELKRVLSILPRGPDHSRLAHELVRRLVREGASKDALAWIDAELRGSVHSLAIGEILSATASTDSRAALDLLDQRQWLVSFIGSNYRTRGNGASYQTSKLLTAVESAVLSIAAEEPQEALGRVARMPSNELRGSLISAIVERWGDDDPSGAARWLVDGHKAGITQNKDRLQGVVRAWAQQDLQSTTAFLRDLEDPGVRENVIFGMQEALAIRDPEAYIDWLTSTDWKLTGATASIGADRLARGNPQAAADAILRSNDARTHSSVFVESFVSTWSETDPIAALQWTTDHNLFDRVSDYSQIVQKWASEDAKAASQWLVEFEGDASTYSWAVTGLVNALAGSIEETQDYEAVFTWASMSNVRNGNLAPLLKDWLAQDPGAARAFFETHDVRGISEDQLFTQPAPSSP